MSEVQGGQPPAPVVRGEPREVAPDVWVIPDGRVPLVPNVGIIVGESAVLVVDTGMGPQNGAHVRRVAEELGGGRRLFVTLTHFHPEHGFGAQAFAGDGTIVYNRGQLHELRDKGESYLEMFATFGESVADALDGTTLIEPDVVYDGAVDLHLGGRTASLRTWGLAHTRGDQIVSLSDDGVLFTGDLVERDMFAIFPFFPPEDADVDGDRWITVLEELERLEPRVVVPGHGDVGDAGLLVTAREYIQQLRASTLREIKAGVTAEDAVVAIQQEFLALHPDWAQPEWISFGVRSYYAKLA